MEQGSVEAARMQIDGLAPRTGDLLGGDEEVVDVHPLGNHASVNDVKQTLLLVVAQIRRPDALAGGQHREAELRLVRENVGDELPVLEIPRMVDRNTRKPFKGGCCDIVILPPAADAGIGMKAGKNRIADHESASSGDFSLSSEYHPALPQTRGLFFDL